MRSLGAAHLLVFGVFVVLVLDSRRFHALARLTGLRQRNPVVVQGIPAGSNAEQVGIPLRLIQMRTNVDWQDGGLGWEGPEILEADEWEPYDEYEAYDEIEDEGAAAPVGPVPSLPVLWTMLPALLPAGATGDWLAPETPVETPVLVGAGS